MSAYPNFDCWGFIIDTDQYAGNFERELCAWTTGQIGECEVGKEYSFVNNLIGKSHKTRWLEIKYKEPSKTGKTHIFDVLTSDGGTNLGKIKWFGPWRKYAFFPEQNTLFETDCLSDISKFLDDLKNKK